MGDAFAFKSILQRTLLSNIREKFKLLIGIIHSAQSLLLTLGLIYIYYIDHNKVSVYKNLEVLFDDLVDNSNDVNEVQIFSDGATSQFKQRLHISLLPVFRLRYGVNFYCKFLATSYGKGVVDGIGATVKGAVWRRVRGNCERLKSSLLQLKSLAQT